MRETCELYSRMTSARDRPNFVFDILNKLRGRIRMRDVPLCPVVMKGTYNATNPLFFVDDIITR